MRVDNILFGSSCNGSKIPSLNGKAGCSVHSPAVHTSENALPSATIRIPAFFHSPETVKLQLAIGIDTRGIEACFTTNPYPSAHISLHTRQRIKGFATHPKRNVET
jgi:hypothetical protein